VCVCVCARVRVRVCVFKNNILRKISPKLFHEEDICFLWAGQSGTWMGGEETEIINAKRSVHLGI
jgi:hypothetical protein